MSFSKLAVVTSLMFSSSLCAPYNNIAQTDCTETIEVTDIDFRQSVDCTFFNNFPCNDLVGTYYFTGYDSQGTPKYTQPSTGAFFSIQIDQVNNPTFGVLASTGFTYDGSYFAPGWDHFADIKFIDQCTNTDLFEVELGALQGDTNVLYFPKQNAPYPPLYITAFLDDCLGIGFDNQPPTLMPSRQPSIPTLSPTVPTAVPSNAPTSPTMEPTIPTPRPTKAPVSGITCPNYDYTESNDCSNDENCASCQPWGCANCVSGYYKMGNQMRCQSCTDNYPGCSQCGDWNGCTTCDAGYLLDYSPTCDDEICQ